MCMAYGKCMLLFFFLNSGRAGIDEKRCAEAISTYQLPNGDLLGQCENLLDAKVGVHSYRRLLPANYADGLSKVYLIFIPCFIVGVRVTIT